MLCRPYRKILKKIVKALAALHSVSEEQLKVAKESRDLLKEINHKLPPLRTTQVGIQFNHGEITMPFALILTTGQSSVATIIPLEADGTTITPGAVVSAQTFSITDPGISLVTNADGTATITGVGPTTGAVSGTASATVTDVDGTTAPFSQTFTVTVNAPTQHTASIGLTFSAPQ